MPRANEGGPRGQSRLSAYRKSGKLALLPRCRLGRLAQHLMDAGPGVSNGMGYVSLDWRDIRAWQKVTGIRLSRWEVATIRRISSAYVQELHEAEDPLRKAPWMSAQMQSRDRTTIARSMDRMFDQYENDARLLAAAKKKQAPKRAHAGPRKRPKT